MSIPNRPKTLGRVKHTERGFELIEFKDHYELPCSLQASSMAVFQKPGTSAIWLGCENNCFHPSTNEAMSPRMHLDREQVKALVRHLTQWLEKDTFELS